MNNEIDHSSPLGPEIQKEAIKNSEGIKEGNQYKRRSL